MRRVTGTERPLLVQGVEGGADLDEPVAEESEPLDDFDADGRGALVLAQNLTRGGYT